jgi:hypothetical protein
MYIIVYATGLTYENLAEVKPKDTYQYLVNTFWFSVEFQTHW